MCLYWFGLFLPSGSGSCGLTIPSRFALAPQRLPTHPPTWADEPPLAPSHPRHWTTVPMRWRSDPTPTTVRAMPPRLLDSFIAGRLVRQWFHIVPTWFVLVVLSRQSSPYPIAGWVRACGFWCGYACRLCAVNAGLFPLTQHGLVARRYYRITLRSLLLDNRWRSLELASLDDAIYLRAV